MTDEHDHTEQGLHFGLASYDTIHGDDRMIIDTIHGDDHGHDFFTPEMYALSTALAIYSKAFVEALAKRHADGLADLLRTRLRKNHTEAEIGLDGNASATIAITTGTPDEARLALLDLDVTADELRGKMLQWDTDASAWRPADDE